MATLLTYDVSAKNVDVKARLKKAGYLDSWQDNGKTYYLPNTTLWSSTKSAADAKTDLEAIAQALLVRLERAVAVRFDSWAAVPGDPHKP